MSSVDSRIVTMKFDNAQFEKGASTTLSTLDRLKKAMGFEGASKGLNDVQAAVDKTHFGAITGGIDKVNLKFAAMATVAITALSNITTKAMAVGTQLVKSLTLQPVMDGFAEYELKMKSIQTILANTEAKGTTLKDVNASLKELNEYADKTIYSFSEMTKTVGLFTNAGIGIEDATAMIKGFSNAAAASGATAEGTARAQYQLSQALTTGTIRLMDWKSLTNAGMGNKNMQTSLIELADAMGTFEGTSITAKDAADNFNGSLEKEWLSADVMEQYLKIMANEVTPAQMKAIGLSAEQIESMQQQAKTAEEAATKVRTFTQLLATTREAIGSGWASTFEIILGDFTEATELFSGISTGISGFVNKASEARNKMLQDWKDLGGRDVLIEGFKKALEGLKSILAPIAKAFREIFPATTAKQLYDLTFQFKEFAEKIKIGSDTAEKLKDTFKGFFSIFSIVGQVVKGFIGVIFDLVGAIGKGSGGFLSITAGIGNFLSGVDSALKNGTGLTTFFETLSAVLQTPIKLIQALTTYIFGVFGGFSAKDGDAVNGTFQRMAERLGPLAQLFQAVQDAMGVLSEKFKTAAAFMAPYIDALKNALSSIGDALRNAFSGADINTILRMINTGLFAALIVMVRKFLTNFKMDFSGGLIDTIKDTFGTLTGTLQTMQTNIKADTLFKIGAAVALLTASIAALALIDSDKLTKAMVAITGAFIQLMGAMAILTKIGGMTGFVKIPIIAAGMILLSGAVFILAMAIKSLAKLDWNGIAKGLVGVSGAMIVLVAGVQPLTKVSGGMISTGIGLLFLAGSMKLMASAVGSFASYDLGSIVKGLVSIIAVLLILAKTMQMMPKDLPFLALGLVGIAFAMNIMAGAVAKMGEINFGQMLQGLGGLGAAIIGIALALGLMPPNMVLTAIALVGVSIALSQVADAIVSMGKLSWSEVAKGLVGLAGALIVLGIAMVAMGGSIMGAVALTALAVAIGFMVPALKALGNLSLKEIGVALLALAATFTVLGIAAYVIGPLSVVVLALAGSLALLGAAVALTGLGMLAFAKAIEILVKLGSAAAGAIGMMLTTIISAIPQLFKAFADGIVQFTVAITKNAPVFANAMLVALNAILDTINKMAPKIANTMSMLLGLLLDKIVENSPKITKAGYQVLMDMLKKLNDNIYQIVDVATEIMIKFAKAIGDKSGKVADEGAKMIIKFINAAAESIRNNSKAMNDAGRNLTSAIISGMIGGITSGASGVIQAIIGMAKSAIDAAKRILGIKSPSKEFETIGMFVSSGLSRGVDDNAYLAENSAEQMGQSMLEKFKASLSGIDALVESEINATPVITPVLDLSELERARKIDEALRDQRGDAEDKKRQLEEERRLHDEEERAKKLRELLDIPGLFTQSPSSTSFGAASYRQAASIATDTTQFSDTRLQPDASSAEGTTTINYEQNNYSPKALSAVEIYRQTKNQLALTKGALAS